MKSDEKAAAEGVLFTDMYQLTMAQLYHRAELGEREALFEHFFRSYPDYGKHQAGYCVSAGLDWLLDWMTEAAFQAEDIDYLRAQDGSDGRPLFDNDFLAYLDRGPIFDRLVLEAVPEGRVVHPIEPVVVVRGPLPIAQLLETALLNHLNYQTLIATKASRVSESGRGRPVLEFGLRRAAERGGSAGTRAALIGGADLTSNVGMSRAMGLRPAGTHAHSVVQVFLALGLGEIGAFRAYADAFPDDCLLLVDTIDTLKSGMPNAIQVFTELKEQGHEPLGVRLDSGDLAYLSIQASLMLDEAGFPDAAIVLSNQLEELAIWQILAQIDDEAPRYGLDPGRLIERLRFGVGSRLITSHGAGYLDGVYKVVAVREDDDWTPAIKLSDSSEKATLPGNKQVWRVYDDRGRATADVLALREEELMPGEPLLLHHPTRYGTQRELGARDVTSVEPLLERAFEAGKPVGPEPELEELRSRRRRDVELLDPGVRRLVNPHRYHVSLTDRLWRLRQDLADEIGG